MNPYALAEGEGRSYERHDVVFTIKAAGPETGGAFALWEVTTRPGEEPHDSRADPDNPGDLSAGTALLHRPSRCAT